MDKHKKQTKSQEQPQTAEIWQKRHKAQPARAAAAQLVAVLNDQVCCAIERPRGARCEALVRPQGAPRCQRKPVNDQIVHLWQARAREKGTRGGRGDNKASWLTYLPSILMTWGPSQSLAQTQASAPECATKCLEVGGADGAVRDRVLKAADYNGSIAGRKRRQPSDQSASSDPSSDEERLARLDQS